MNEQEKTDALQESEVEKYKAAIDEYDPRQMDKTELFFAIVIGLLSGFTAAAFIIQVVL